MPRVRAMMTSDEHAKCTSLTCTVNRSRLECAPVPRHEDVPTRG